MSQAPRGKKHSDPGQDRARTCRTGATNYLANYFANMSMTTRRRSRESDDSEEERASKRSATSEEETATSSDGTSESEEEAKGVRPEHIITYRCRVCRMAMRTTKEKANNHARYCSSKAKQQNLKQREKVKRHGSKKGKGKKGKQSRRYD